MGRAAVRQAAEILAAGAAGAIPHAHLRPGARWHADYLLLSIGRDSVQFLAGNVLYQEDLVGFFSREFLSGAQAFPGRAPWLAGLLPHEMPFSMSLAATLALACDETVSGCAFLERFSCFYCSHRTLLEQAARELRYVLDGLFALDQQPAMLAPCLDSMGELAGSCLPKGVAPADIGSFLGRFLIGAAGDGISLAGLPSVVHQLRESLAEETTPAPGLPHLRRMLTTLEHSAERAAPVLALLRAAW